VEDPLSQPTAGVMPPVDTWHPQVRRWVHAAWEQAGGLDGGRLALAQLVKALWSAGDPWSRAYRHLFAGAPAPPSAPVLAVPDDEVFYAGEPDLVELMEEASRLGAGRIHPWAILGLVAERTQRSAQQGSPGLEGVQRAPVEAVGEGTLVRAHRGATPDDALDWASGRQIVAIIVDDRISSSSERYNTPYVEDHFHLLADDAWVLREPSSQAAFWVLEGVSPDAADSLPQALREVRRQVPGFVPWLPLRAGLRTDSAPRVEALLAPLRTLPRLLLTTEPGSTPRDDEADTLIVALDAATGGIEGSTTVPVLGDHPGPVDDVLGHARLAASICSSLAHDHTQPPFVLAVLGPSGSGRTDLLGRIESHWRALVPPQEGTPPPLHSAALSAPDLQAGVAVALADALSGTSTTGRSTMEHEFFGGSAPSGGDRQGNPDAGSTRPVPAAGALGVSRQAWSLLLPGAVSSAPRGAVSTARAGLLLSALGGAGVLAAPPDWTAFVPAALLGAGLWLTARGLGAGLLHEPVPDVPVAPPVSTPRPTTDAPPARIRRALSGCSRLLLTVDDLDRVPQPDAARILAELRRLLDGAELPPTVLVLGSTLHTLQHACPADHPVHTYVQVPLWTAPVRARTASKALAAWTGLPAPRVVGQAPSLRTVSGPGPVLPDPVPIHVEADDTGELGPSDLDALVQLEPLVPPSPRAWKRLVNQARWVRPHLPPGTSAAVVATWLVLAAADPAWPAAIRGRLASGQSLAQALRQPLDAAHQPALERIPDAAWPDEHALLRAADDVLRWTFAGPFAVHSPAEQAPSEARRSA